MKLIFLIYGGNKQNMEGCGLLYLTKIHIIHIVHQTNYQSIPPFLWPC